MEKGDGKKSNKEKKEKEKMKRITLLLGIFLIGAILLACSPKVAPLEKPIPPVLLTPETQIKEGWEEEWEKTLQAARKEGKIVVFTTTGGDMRDVLSRAFKERYGIGADFMVMRGEEMMAKLTAERRAGLYTSDIYQGGAQSAFTYLKARGYLESLEPQLLLPEVLDPRLWWEGEFPWLDKDRTIIGFVANASTPVVINTNLVKADEITSYKDLLKPKWKGKILMNDVTRTGAGFNWFNTAQLITGPEFMRELAKQDPVIITNYRLQVEGLAKGKYLIFVAADYDNVMVFIRAGAPLKGIIPIEGTYKSTSGGNITLFNRAPHPYAAKLYINWLLSKEGQKAYVLAVGYASARIDVPPEGVEPSQILNPKLKYIFAQSEENLLRTEENLKIAKEIFGHFKQ